MKNNGFGNTKIYFGIEILRLLLCLWIVIAHCSVIKTEHKKYILRGFHVPTFILLSFVFYFPILKQRVISKIISRFQRLLIPYIFWPLLILIINNILIDFFAIGQFPTKLSLCNFCIQIIIAGSYHSIFWFQFNLIFISLLFTIISFIFKDKTLRIFIFFSIISFFFHISGLNYDTFKRFKNNYGKNMGSIIELIPIAVIGCVLKNQNFLIIIKNYSIYFRLILVFIIFMLFKYDMFIYQKGFRYPDVLLDSVASIILFSLFGSLPFDKIKKQKFKYILSIMTKYTGGIYYIHTIFNGYFKRFSFYFKNGTYLSSFVIYIICYIFCFIGNKLFRNSKFKYLFM